LSFFGTVIEGTLNHFKNTAQYFNDNFDKLWTNISISLLSSE